MKGTVLGGTNNFFAVEDSNKNVITCSLKGKKIKTDGDYYNPIAPGDKIEFEPDNLDSSKGQIIELLPRQNKFGRWNIKGRKMQILAANLENVLIVTTPEQPPFRPRFIDRILAQCEFENIEPIILCNKCDLPAAQDPDFQSRLANWESIGYSVVQISAKTGVGLPELAALLENKLTALVGQSGVGKSSIVNVLDNTCVLKTGSLSEKYGKGSHTTTKGTLIHLNLNESLVGGIHGATASIIDTPGIRRFILHDIPSKDLHFYFREFKPLVGKCSFGMSCSHKTEAGCKILEAVYSGIISEERYDSWKRITEEIETGSFQD